MLVLCRKISTLQISSSVFWWKRSKPFNIPFSLRYIILYIKVLIILHFIKIYSSIHYEMNYSLSKRLSTNDCSYKLVSDSELILNYLPNTYFEMNELTNEILFDLLGVTFDRGLGWYMHITTISTSAPKKFWFLFRAHLSKNLLNAVLTYRELRRLLHFTFLTVFRKNHKTS